MKLSAVYLDRAHTRDGARIESRVYLYQLARVLEARGPAGLILAGFILPPRTQRENVTVK